MTWYNQSPLLFANVQLGTLDHLSNCHGGKEVFASLFPPTDFLCRGICSGDLLAELRFSPLKYHLLQLYRYLVIVMLCFSAAA